MNSHCIYGAYSLGAEQIMSHRGEPCDRSKSTPGSCQLCPCGSFLPSQENPFPPSAGLFSHLQCSGGLHRAPHRQGAPGKTALFPQPSCTPDLAVPLQPLSHTLSGCRALSSWRRGVPCHLSSFLTSLPALKPFVFFLSFCLGNFQTEQGCSSNAMSVFVSLV